MLGRKIASADAPRPAVSTAITNRNVMMTPTRDMASTAPPAAPPTPAQQSAEPTQPQQIPEKKNLKKVVVSHVVSPGEFYLQTAESKKDLNRYKHY